MTQKTCDTCRHFTAEDTQCKGSPETEALSVYEARMNPEKCGKAGAWWAEIIAQTMRKD